MVASQQLAPAYPEDRDRCVVAVAGVPDDIAVTPLDLEHDRRLLQPLQSRQHIAQLGGALEVESFGGIHHALPNRANDVAAAALEKLDDLVDHDPVVFSRLRQDARRLAPLDVVVQARPLRHLPRHVVATRAHGEELLDDVERAAHGADIGIGSEVARSIRLEAPGDDDPRKRLLNGHLDVRVGLIVPQRDVEPRPVFLDQVGFENQRVRLARHDDGLQISHLSHEGLRFHTFGVVSGEIAPDPRAQPLGFADVQDPPLRVFPEIHSGRLREVGYLGRHQLGHCEHDGSIMATTD